ncbi:MAG TPA: PfkB family carbohydrate kinase [Candidatus Andersenbacteria bacterium]|nr:PfkB family carbohydrate kinase [Candidatus Andersenbacteria bacterium]
MKPDFRKKIVALDDFKRIIPLLKKQGKIIVHCHGVFDLVHPGHIKHFYSAKNAGDILIVTITADKFVKRGPGRPIFNHSIRTETLSALEVVDYVAIVHGPTADEAITAIRPDLYAKGPDYKNQAEDITGKISEEEALVKKMGGKLLITEDVTFSSSKLINDHIESYPTEVRTYLAALKKKYSADDIARHIASLKKLKVLVIGDAIIDQYHYCTPLGKSSKEPLVVNQFEYGESYAGGVLATANHMAGILKNVTLVSVLGKLDTQKEFIRQHLKKNIRTKLFLRPDSQTIVKRRYVSTAQNRKLFEICFMNDNAIPRILEKSILSYLRDNILKFDIVIVNDFGHGLMTERIVQYIIKKAKKLAINVQTNSANAGFNLVNKYPHADFVCVDEMELRYATHDRFGNLQNIAQRIQKDLGAILLITTRGSKGSLAYIPKRKEFSESPALTASVVDAVGAGDAFFAYTAPAFGGKLPHDIIAFLGNVVGAIAVQIVGNKSSVEYVDVMKFITRLLK